MTDTLRRACLTAVTGLGLCLTLLPAGQAQAQAPQTPTRVPCNDIAALKTAINTANTKGGSIVLAPRCVYSLTTADNPDDGLPEITGTVRISGGDRTTIQRSPSATGGFRIFHVQQSGSLSLDSVTVRGGDAAGTGAGDRGGALYNDRGRLNLTGVTVRNNRAGFIAGGIWNNLGTLTLKDTTVHDNSSVVAGGVATSGTMTMRGGAIRGNVASDSAGGLANAGDTTLNNAAVDGNDSEEFGGGIMTLDINGRTGPLRLNSTQVSGNIASLRGGGILIGSRRPTTLYRSSVTGNAANGGPGSGGGILNDGSQFGVILGPDTLERKQSSSATQTLPKVNLIKSTVFRNTPDNCAPPNSVPHCDAVGSAPATNTPRPGKS
ncbi:MAG TPA: hypothetical protein VGO89_20225 [Streptomyces sp.]|nr:hypothetical protein [Streptomyces sp.]